MWEYQDNYRKVVGWRGQGFFLGGFVFLFFASLFVSSGIVKQAVGRNSLSYAVCMNLTLMLKAMRPY